MIILSPIVPVFAKKKLRFRRRHPGETFSAHMDNFRCHNRRMTATELTIESLGAVNTHSTCQI
jgi:hypothetical protein